MKTSTDQMTIRAAEIEKRQSEIAETRAPLVQDINAVTEQVQQLASEVQARDWSIGARTTGKKPYGAHSDGGIESTYKRRAHFYAQRLAAEHDLSALNTERQALDKEDSALCNELATLRRAMVTPEQLDIRIIDATAELSHLTTKRHPLVRALDVAQAQQATIEADSAAEPEAVAALERARADAYLAPDDAAARAVVDSAEIAAALAREKAAGARAAAPRVGRKVHNACDALATHDEATDRISQAIHALRTQRDVLIARKGVSSAVHSLGNALCQLIAADEREGARLLDAWTNVGVRELDCEGQPCLPDWLRTCLNQAWATRRLAMASVLEEMSAG